MLRNVKYFYLIISRLDRVRYDCIFHHSKALGSEIKISCRYNLSIKDYNG
jgi:hypothetical protein